MKTFSKAIEQISYRHQTSLVFDDFMEMAICAFSIGRMEDRYFELIKRYSKEELHLFAEAMACMIAEYEMGTGADGSWVDVVGRFFEEYNSTRSSQSLGQFFTPPSICDLMAKITSNEITEETSVCDPTCGSGRNLISHSRLAAKNRLLCMYYGMDIDRRCVNMTVINMVMHGMRGVVIHMNTLSMEVYGGYRIYLPETGLGVVPLSKEAAEGIVTITKSVQSQTPTKNGQLILF